MQTDATEGAAGRRPARDAGNSARLALVAGLLVALAVALASVWVAWVDREQTATAERRQLELLARVLEDNVSRTVDTASVALASLAQSPAVRDYPLERSRAEQALQGTLRGLPFMRALALVDGHGTVLASTTPGESGTQLALRALGAWPAEGRDAVGAFVAARSLSGLRRDAQEPAAPSGVGFIPLLRQVTGGDGQPLLLVGLINPDAFANYQRQMVGDDGRRAALLSYRGDLLASSHQMERLAGRGFAGLPVFASFLPRRESASYAGAGIDGPRQIAAFRTSRNRPLVVLVEQSQERVTASWVAGARGYVAIGASAIAVILALSVLAWRGLRGREAARTLRDAAQQELQTQLALSERLLEATPLPIAMTDRNGCLLIVNQAWERFKGLPRGVALGRSLQVLLPADEAEAHAKADRALLEQGGTLRYEARARHSDGTPRDIRFVKTVVPDGRGNPAGILSVLMDVTEFREAERTTREAQDALEETARAKAEFIANMSHELRTPLQSIIGFSELGLLRGKHEPRLASMFEDIHGAGHRMLALVNDLLDVAKLESAVGTFHLETVDLRGPLRAVVREFEPLLAPRRLDLRLELPAEPMLAKADPTRFEQVVRNVIANAVKFSPEGGCIRVLGEGTVQGELHLRVCDQGPGIPEAELERIFDPFVQSSKTKDGSGGTGLGLAICRKIVQAHGGRIAAENLPRGTAFHIHLPRRAGAETQPAMLA